MIPLTIHFEAKMSMTLNERSEIADLVRCPKCDNMDSFDVPCSCGSHIRKAQNKYNKELKCITKK